MTITDSWQEQVVATKAWLDRRDSAPRQNGVYPEIGPGLVSLYLEFLGRHRRTRVLDIGCGRGKRRQHFLGGYVGIDAMAEPDRAAFPLVRGRAEELPWPDASFDGVLIIEALDHFEDPARTAAEALRVLRSGGDLLIFLRNGAPEAPAEAAVHHHLFDAPGLTALFAHGLAAWRLAEDASYMLLLGERR
jgi:SAM-dependent methyltransferase